MGLLRKLKSALGLESESADSRDGDVTVEHDPDAENEAAVKGTDDPAAAGTDAGGSTASVTEEPPETPGDDEVAEAAEPAEAAGPASQVEDPEPGDDDAEPSDDATGDADDTADAAEGSAELTETPPGEGAAEPAEAAGPGDADVEGADEDVETLSGIGPAYAERLAEGGVETVGDLLAADPADLAEASGVSETRIERWQDRARGD